MYRRTVGQRTLTFGVSGKLWRNALVMYDRETSSLWSHLTGKCIWGAFEGEKLEMVTSVPKIKWKDWHALHPTTKVLTVQDEEYVRHDNYAEYHKSRRTGLFETERVDDRLREKDLVIGVIANGQHKAYPLNKKYWKTKEKKQWQLVQDMLGEMPIVVFHDPDMHATGVFDRRLEDETVVEFVGRTDGHQGIDSDGGRWNLLTGSGPAGHALKSIPHMNVYWFAWSDFYPQTLLWITKGTK
ncbi:MAG: DUF3179 domain-containing protein [Candidatus Latescibacteria bacterium]|nr:DUF3179 domain-containing protein [Candidatus Latescibacterota bacterium]